MRTTVTLDPENESAIRRLMERRGLSFKQALNDLIRSGVGSSGSSPAPFRTQVRHMGVPTVALEKALQLAGDLEDEEIIRRMRTGQ
ncbi:hypothetical protein BJY21_003689 [Kineosphaera limosa]|uniref:Antitoxin n=1 Tax=Kineosphaera limosa NBRC 100340 TaxID=1184609 RepID=K6W9U0_9MICO|nr:hypothetical protein [Kineosphaera limosa]NYE02505.1 hypothetical protein [Kineosphaera limosa]GAB95970.1 hypothetical protein KILIM_030_00120 [Kineosphaera limosa NBRC 100340]